MFGAHINKYYNVLVWALCFNISQFIGEVKLVEKICLNLKQRIPGLIKEKLKKQENVIFSEVSIPKGGNRFIYQDLLGCFKTFEHSASLLINPAPW